MHDRVGAALERGGQRGLVADVALDQAEAIVAQRGAQIRALVRLGIERIERVEADDRAALGEQVVCEPLPDLTLKGFSRPVRAFNIVAAQ